MVVVAVVVVAVVVVAVVVLAVVVVAVVVVAVVVRSSAILEPDHYAHHASIIALSHAQIRPSNAQYLALKASLSFSGMGVVQWHHMASGYWTSEKSPGHPFVAIVFHALGLRRATLLFYGALACVGLFVGLRRWAWERATAVAAVAAVAAAVRIYCCSGAALTLARHSMMPPSSGPSRIAAGFDPLVRVLVVTAFLSFASMSASGASGVRVAAWVRFSVL